MAKTVIVCCDGTASSVDGNISNVLKLFRMMVKDGDQVAYYHPGIGTVGATEAMTELRQKFWSVVGMAFGFGLNDQILAAYRFLAETWQPGDRIMLFGFSRGAYTVRALAGMLHVVGLIAPPQLAIAEFALGAYKAAREGMDADQLWDFGRTFACRRVTIDFVGVWDTVASVIEPHFGRQSPSFLQKLPFTQANPAIRVFRQALAIDERRRMFRPYRWHGAAGQDSRQRWFAGTHTDIGGGYRESESGLGKIALRWLADEAGAHGLRLDLELYRHLVLGEATAAATHPYVGPDPAAPLHNSLTLGWWPLELLPRPARLREWRRRLAMLGWYLPLGEPRTIPHNQAIDPSVAARRAAVPGYAPVNLP